MKGGSALAQNNEDEQLDFQDFDLDAFDLQNNHTAVNNQTAANPEGRDEVSNNLANAG